MLAEERDHLIPSPLTTEHGSQFPWAMAAIAVAMLIASVALYCWFLRRTRDRN